MICTPSLLGQVRKRGGEKAGKKQDTQKPLQSWPPAWRGTERQAGRKEVRLERQALTRLPWLPRAPGRLPAGLMSSGLTNLDAVAFGRVGGVQALRSPPQTTRTQFSLQKPKTHSLSKLRKCIANLPSLTHDTMVFSSSGFHGGSRGASIYASHTDHSLSSSSSRLP